VGNVDGDDANILVGELSGNKIEGLRRKGDKKSDNTTLVGLGLSLTCFFFLKLAVRKRKVFLGTEMGLDGLVDSRALGAFPSRLLMRRIA